VAASIRSIMGKRSGERPGIMVTAQLYFSPLCSLELSALLP